MRGGYEKVIHKIMGSHLQIEMPQMLRGRIHHSPSFQFGVFLCNPVRDQRRIGLQPLFVRDRVPIVCGVVAIAVRFGSDEFRHVDHGGGGRCEDEAFEGRVLLSRLEDGERSGDCGVDYHF